MQMQSVRSSAIQAIGYDVQTHRLFIQFIHNPKIYTYCRVPEAVYSSFMAANSKGSYYDLYIKDNYNCP